MKIPQLPPRVLPWKTTVSAGRKERYTACRHWHVPLGSGASIGQAALERQFATLVVAFLGSPGVFCVLLCTSSCFLCETPVVMIARLNVSQLHRDYRYAYGKQSPRFPPLRCTRAVVLDAHLPVRERAFASVLPLHAGSVFRWFSCALPNSRVKTTRA